jgi:hypothetical protein
MRQHRNYGIVTKLAVENLEDNAVVPGEEPVATPVEAGADSVEADLVEVNADVVQIVQDDAIVADAAEAVDELEDTAVALESIAQNGGLDRNGARVLNMFMVSINRRMGYPDNYKTMSVESFGGTNDKASQTKLAAESIAEKAKELWGKIVEMFRSAIQGLVNIWNRLFDGATKLKARAENLAKAAAENKGEKSGDTFENQTLATNLQLGGNINVKEAAKRIAQEASVLETISKASIAFAGKAASLVESGDLGMVTQLVHDVAGPTQQGFAKVADAASVGVPAPGEGVELFKSEELPGNKAIIAFVPGAGANAAALGQAGYKLGTFDASKKIADAAKLPVLSTQDVVEVAKQISLAADSLLSYKKYQQEAEAAAKKVIALAEKKAKETVRAEAGADASMVDKAKAAGKAVMSGSDERAVAKAAMSLVINSVPPLAAYAINAGTSALQYGEQSLKQYGKKVDEKKPEGAAAPAAA